MGEASFGHGPLVPLLLDLVLPFLPLACMPLADAFFAFLDPIRQCFVDVDALAASSGQRRECQRAVAQHPKVPVVVLVVISGPLADLNIGKADIDPFAVRRRNYGDFTGLSVSLWEPRVQSTTSSAAIRSTPLKASGWKLTLNG